MISNWIHLESFMICDLRFVLCYYFTWSICYYDYVTTVDMVEFAVVEVVDTSEEVVMVFIVVRF